MKKIIVMMILIGAMSSFRGMEKLPADPINAKELTGYSLKTRNIVFNDFNLWVFTNNVAFENTFVADNEMVVRPSFENELVLAAKVETLSRSYKILFKKIEMVKSELNVYFTVVKEGPARNGAGPVSLVAYPKNPQVKKVNYYHGNMLVRTIPIVTVY